MDSISYRVCYGTGDLLSSAGNEPGGPGCGGLSSEGVAASAPDVIRWNNDTELTLAQANTAGGSCSRSQRRPPAVRGRDGGPWETWDQPDLLGLLQMVVSS